MQLIIKTFTRETVQKLLLLFFVDKRNAWVLSQSKHQRRQNDESRETWKTSGEVVNLTPEHEAKFDGSRDVMCKIGVRVQMIIMTETTLRFWPNLLAIEIFV